jgi:predicted ATPase
MFSRIEAQHYKCLRSIVVRLEPFNVLIGLNASGKSTFLDVLGFLKDALDSNEGVDEAVRVRGGTLKDLVWHGAEKEGQPFELAVESSVPLGGEDYTIAGK